MAIRYERHDERRRINILTSADVTHEEVIGALDRQAAEGAWSYGVLYDARASRYTPSADEFRSLILRVGELTARYGPRGPVAFQSLPGKFENHPVVHSSSNDYILLLRIAAGEVGDYTVTTCPEGAPIQSALCGAVVFTVAE